MKIAQVTPAYYPNIGGIETHVKEISERLARNHEIEVICADLRPSLNQTENINGVKVTRFSSLLLKNSLFFAPSMLSYLRNNRYDIVHAHNYHAFPAFFASRIADTTFIFTPHYHGKGSNAFTNILLKPYHHWGKKIFNRAKKIICVSEFEKNLVKKDFNLQDERLTIIPNGINIRMINEARPFSIDRNLILYLGRLDRYKHIDSTVRAMTYLPDFDFYIIGRSGNYKENLHKLIKSLNLENRVKILDRVSDQDKYRWLKTCSVFINLSDTEAFGITVLEAIAAGKSVIVNNSGGLREFVGKYSDEVIGIEKNQLADDHFSSELANLIKRRSGLEFSHDLLWYNWSTISQKIEQEYSKYVK
jgi:glycosyltransferase involved in cell wall biosynthesis